MTRKQDVVERLAAETKAGINFSKRAIEFAKEGKINKAWRMLEVAQCALKCVNTAHEQLWDLSKGDLTNEEFEIFCESETLESLFNRAVQTAKLAARG